MAQIESYKLLYAPNGNGRILFKIVGNTQVQNTGMLPVQTFTALALVLAQSRLEVDDNGVFSSFDTGNVNLHLDTVGQDLTL